jgi:hypothetical protein
MTRPLSCFPLALCVALVVSPLQAQTVYQWKDAKGVTHYSDSPPPKGATVREIRAPKGTPATPATPATNVAASSKAPKTEAAPAEVPAPPAAPQVVADKAKCEMAQHNLASLQSDAPVGIDTDSDGNPDSEIGAEERTKYVGLAREAIQANCPGGG